MLFPARLVCSLKRRGRFASRCVSGRSQSSPRRAFCKGGEQQRVLFNQQKSPEESPLEQGISRNRNFIRGWVEVCLKFPGNDAVRTGNDSSGVPFPWFLPLGTQRKEQKMVFKECNKFKNCINGVWEKKHGKGVCCNRF